MRNVYFTGEFKRNLRQLAKKYRRIKTDIQEVLEDLEQGATPGDQISGVAFVVYKVRARNSDTTKGKSGGYRIIYQHTPEDTIILVTVYSKTEQSDISPQEIQLIINTYEQERSREEAQQEEDAQAQRAEGDHEAGRDSGDESGETAPRPD